MASFIEGRKSLFVGAHPDDIEHGCGGTISKYNAKCEMHSIIFAPCLEDPLNAGILKEYKTAMKGLGVKKAVNKNMPRDSMELHSQEIRNTLFGLKREFGPEIVFCPSHSDLHQDHKVVADCCLTIFRDTATILAYEITRSLGSFCPDLFIALSEHDLATKLKALHCYKTQYRRSYFKPSTFKALAIIRGQQINARYAEAFEVMRMIEK